MIIIRQRGLKFKPGENVGCGKDFTLYALKAGILHYSSVSKKINIKEN